MFDVGTAIVMAEGSADVAPSGISPEIWAAILGSSVVTMIVSSLIGLVGWLARGKLQRSMDSLVSLEDAAQKLRTSGDGNISPIKQNQLDYVNVLMAVELSRRIIPVPSAWSYVGVVLSGIVTFVIVIGILIVVDAYWVVILCVSIFLVLAYFFIYFSIEYQRVKQKRKRVDTACQMVNDQLNLVRDGSDGGKKGDFSNFPVDIEELIPYPASSTFELLKETVNDLKQKKKKKKKKNKGGE